MSSPAQALGFFGGFRAFGCLKSMWSWGLQAFGVLGFLAFLGGAQDGFIGLRGFDPLFFEVRVFRLGVSEFQGSGFTV